MSILSELWFLVSTAILEFKTWKTRRKKIIKPSCESTLSILTIFRINFSLSAFILISFWIFSTFSSSSTKFVNTTEAELGTNISDFYSTAGAKTLKLNRFQNSCLVKKSVQSSNVVSTETDFSFVFRTQKNFL